MGVGFEISIVQQGRNPRLFEVGGVGEAANLAEFAEDVKELLLRTSFEVLKQEQLEGFDKKPRVSVDNKFSKNILDVNHFGKIEFFARENISEILLGIYDNIEKRSPQVTGQYKGSNYVFHNTRLVARDKSEFKSFIKAREQLGFGDNDMFRFINVTPYARKLERYGVSAGRQRTRYRENKGERRKKVFALVPNGAYVLAARAIKRRFKGSASFVKFAFHKNGNRGITVSGSGGFRNTFKKTGQPYLYPMIIFGLAAEGVLRE